MGFDQHFLRRSGVILLGVFVLIFPGRSDAGEPMIVRYQALPRYAYQIELMKQALDRGGETPIRLEGIEEEIPGIRLVDAILSGRTGPNIPDVINRPTDIDMEKKLTPIRIPLEKGLLGWRVFLIRREDRAGFRAVTAEAELKKRTVGMGKDWIDIKIFEHNGYAVGSAREFTELFKMLSHDRFDYLSFGVNECSAIFDQYAAAYPDLAMEDSLAVHYPFARYFWTAGTPKGRRIRERLERGLERMISDGSFDRIFMDHFGDVLKAAKLETRTVFEMKNPILPDTLPLERKELWFSPESLEKTDSTE